MANKTDARASYQSQKNKTIKLNDYKVGDLVLLKRTHGSNPKMSPRYIGPYVVVKRYGPVNWGIEDQESRKSKVVPNPVMDCDDSGEDSKDDEDEYYDDNHEIDDFDESCEVLVDDETYNIASAMQKFCNGGRFSIVLSTAK